MIGVALVPNAENTGFLAVGGTEYNSISNSYSYHDEILEMTCQLIHIFGYQLVCNNWKYKGSFKGPRFDAAVMWLPPCIVTTSDGSGSRNHGALKSRTFFYLYQFFGI